MDSHLTRSGHPDAEIAPSSRPGSRPPSSSSPGPPSAKTSPRCRHGPISVAGERSLVWIFGEVAPGLREDIEAVGATVESSGEDPLVQLVRATRITLVP